MVYLPRCAAGELILVLVDLITLVIAATVGRLVLTQPLILSTLILQLLALSRPTATHVGTLSPSVALVLYEI